MAASQKKSRAATLLDDYMPIMSAGRYALAGGCGFYAPEGLTCSSQDLDRLSGRTTGPRGRDFVAPAIGED
jgi:hypothetical protein